MLGVFLSFGVDQGGPPAASLGNAGQAYRCLVPLVNRYWLANLASMHNAKKLFNTDISGGLPAVLIKMLASTDPGFVRLLPARPEAWTSGTIEGILGRGRIEIRRLSWDGPSIRAVLVSGKNQEIVLTAPGEIGALTVKSGGASTGPGPDSKSRRLRLPAGAEVQVELRLK
jgi:hypothetical protein